MTNPGSLRYGGCAPAHRAHQLRPPVRPPTGPTHHARPPLPPTTRCHHARPSRAPTARTQRALPRSHRPVTPPPFEPAPLRYFGVLTLQRLTLTLTLSLALTLTLTLSLTLTRYFGVLTLQREALPDDEAADQRRPRWCVLGF